MDSKGYWHNQTDTIHEKFKDAMESDREKQGDDRPRFVIAFDIGSTVEIARGSDKMLCVFESVDKNKVTLKPIDEAGKHRPFFELAERVQLSDGTNNGVTARVWDQRNGKLILRTLPV